MTSVLRPDTGRDAATALICRSIMKYTRETCPMWVFMVKSESRKTQFIIIIRVYNNNSL